MAWVNCLDGDYVYPNPLDHTMNGLLTMKTKLHKFGLQ